MRMETRSRWGIVYVAVAFAVVAIVVALSINYFEKKAQAAEAIAISKNFIAGGTLSSTVSASSTPQEPPVSEALSQDLYTQYSSLASNGQFSAKDESDMLAGLVKSHVANQNVVPYITETDLNIAATSSPDTYMKLLAVILTQSDAVKEYELNVFTRTVENGTTTGTPELQADADLYQRIAAALLVMEVPAALADKHLEVVKSVGALSKAVANMGSWSGDPIEAMTDVDTFNKSLAYVQTSVDAVTAAAQAMETNKKS